MNRILLTWKTVIYCVFFYFSKFINEEETAAIIVSAILLWHALMFFSQIGVQDLLVGWIHYSISIKKKTKWILFKISWSKTFFYWLVYMQELIGRRYILHLLPASFLGGGLIQCLKYLLRYSRCHGPDENEWNCWYRIVSMCTVYWLYITANTSAFLINLDDGAMSNEAHLVCWNVLFFWAGQPSPNLENKQQ